MSSSLRRIVLHIGSPKTGTTYLQSMLWRNRRALARRGVHVPGDRQFDHHRAGRDVLEQKRPPAHQWPPWDGMFDELVADIRRSGARTGVISDENLVAATPAQVERAFARLDGFVVDVVYGMRPIAGQVTSQWQESAKNLIGRDLSEWVARIRVRTPSDWFWRVSDVPAIVDRWQPPVGRLHVLTVPRRGAPNDELWQRFLQIVGTSPPRTARVRRPNESLGYVEASLLAQVPSHFPRQVPRNRARSLVQGFLVPRALAGRPHQTPILLSPSERDWVDEETARRRETLRRDDVVLIGDVGELDVRPTSFGAMSLDGAGADVVAATRASLAALLAHEDRQRSRLRRLEAAAGTGGKLSATVSGLRDELADRGMSIVQPGHHYSAEADNRLRAAGVSATDPVAALDAGSKLISELVVDQARRSRRIDELGGTEQSGLFRRVAELVGR